MATLKQQYTFSTYNDEPYTSALFQDILAQSFTTTDLYILTSVKVAALKDVVGSSDVGLVTLSIRAADENGLPTGSDLTSGTFDGDALTDIGDVPANVTQAMTEVTFGSPLVLSGSTQYCIVLNASNTAGGDTVVWTGNDTGRSNPKANYTGGVISLSQEGGAFVAEADSDSYFETYGEGLKVPDSDIKYTKKVIAISNDEFWYESTAGTMSELAAANGDIDVTEQLQAFELAGKVFICNETDLKVADFQNVKITTASLGANPPDHGSILTGGSSGAIMIVDYITALTGATTLYGKNVSAFTFTNGETVTGTDDDSNAISFTTTIEVAGPHWYDWTVYGNSSDYGTMPNKATLGCNYRGRAVISGNDEYPHQWYMSRQLNPWDWVYAANDAQSPVAGNNTDAGEVGDIIVSLSPYRDDYLIFGCASEMHVLTSDPAEGGSIEEIDLTVGMYGPKSFTFDKDGNFYFMGTDGVGVMKARSLTLINLSQPSIPNLLKDEGLDQGTHRVTLGYDPIRHGITICMTKLSDRTNSDFFLDITGGGFFPESYPAACSAYSQLYYKATDQDYKDLLYGCQDGYIRYFNDTTKNDVTTAGTTTISSNVLMPIKDMSEEDEDGQGRMNSLTLVTAGGRANGEFQDTDGLTVDVFTADDAETVVEDVMDGATPFITRTYSGTGRQKRLRKKARGKWIGLMLKNTTASETWVLGRLSVKTLLAGRIK